MHCDKLNNRNQKVEHRQSAVIGGGAAPQLALHLAAILSDAAGGLSYLDRPDPDLAEIRDLLAKIALAGRKAAFAAGHKPLAGEARTVRRAHPGSASHAMLPRPALAVRADEAAPQAEEAPISAPFPSVNETPDAGPAGSKIQKGGLARWQQKRATSLMSRIDLEAPTISDIASACRLSRSYFIRAFKQSFGLTPGRWLQLYRIEHSKKLLLSHDLPIAEIALACGFVDQSHLTRVFSQVVGLPPARWRRHSCG